MEGDAVLVHTGKMSQYAVDNEAFLAGQPGVGLDAALWLYDQGMAVLGSDTTGTEPQPVTDWEHTVHVAMLMERGVHLIEWMSLDAAGGGACLRVHVRLPAPQAARGQRQLGAAGGDYVGERLYETERQDSYYHGRHDWHRAGFGRAVRPGGSAGWW